MSREFVEQQRQELHQGCSYLASLHLHVKQLLVWHIIKLLWHMPQSAHW